MKACITEEQIVSREEKRILNNKESIMLLIVLAYLVFIVIAALYAEKHGRNFWNVIAISLLITPLFLVSLCWVPVKGR